MPSRVFISYSSKDDSEAGAIRDAVRAALEAAGHQVFVDLEKLKPGDEWRRRIRREAVESHAGVILFTPGALTSDWVWHEASIMSLVREFASKFTLISALLPGVTVADLKKDRFAPLGLDGFQLTKTKTSAEVVVEIVQALGVATAQKTLLEELAEQIAVHLSVLHELQLQHLASRLGVDLLQWMPDHGLRSVLAMNVARRVLHQGMKGVHEVLRELAPLLRSERATGLLDILAPLWVPSDVAARIPRIRRRQPPPPWCLGLNGKRVANFTARMLVNRAYWPEHPDLIPVKGGGGEDAVEHIRSEMLESLRASRNYDSLEEAEDYLQQTNEPIFVNLPRHLWDATVLEQLRATYPNATFILHTGENGLKSDAFLPAHFEAMPEVDLQDENEAWVKYGDSIGVLKKYP